MKLFIGQMFEKIIDNFFHVVFAQLAYSFSLSFFFFGGGGGESFIIKVIVETIMIFRSSVN